MLLGSLDILKVESTLSSKKYLGLELVPGGLFGVALEDVGVAGEEISDLKVDASS